MKFQTAGSSFVRVCALTAAAAALTFGSAARAEQPVTDMASGLNLNSAVVTPVSGLTYANAAYSSSSIMGSEIAAADERATLGESFDAPAPQYRPRVYGRPRYEDRWHNSDGSSKIAFEVGGGFTVPAGSTAHYQVPSWKFSVGGGRNFNKHFGVLVQFDFDKMGLTGSNLYNVQVANGDFSQTIDGSTHIWSFTANPVYYFQGGEHTGLYVTGGIGYYRKTTDFTVPVEGCYPSYFGGCYPYTANQTFDSYSSGGFGANGGIGFTYKMSRFSNAKLFAEARYTWIDLSTNYNLFYVPNGFRTGYFPITVGVRW